MSGQSWSIQITSSGFEVDAYGQSGSTLNCQNGDVVSWNNQTTQEHQPYQTDSNYQPTGPQLCDVIEGRVNASSTPGFIPDLEDAEGNATTGQIYYYCQLHPTDQNERGILNVVA
jgi:plastocyanin